MNEDRKVDSILSTDSTPAVAAPAAPRRRSLTARELRLGPLTPIEIPELADPSGAPGVAYLRVLTAAHVLAFSGDNTDLTNVQSILASPSVHRLISDLVVDENGDPLIEPGTDPSTLDVRVYMRLVTAIVSQFGTTFGVGMGGVAEADAKAKEAADAAAGKDLSPQPESTPAMPTPTGSDSPTA